MMKRGLALLAVGAILLLLTPVSALAICTQPTDDASRVETARRILKVNALDWEEVIEFWADDAIYQESVITNYSREEMREYLSKIFAWSSDMELIIKDEIWGYDASGDFVYTATNVWSGTWEGFGPYVQEGMSIVKFRPGEGCAYYQRDYFTEGDTWIGIPELSYLIATMREEYLKIIGYMDKCFDEDGDGYSKYKTTGCTYISSRRDCNDYDPDINPGAAEVPGNGLDDNCNGFVDESLPSVCGGITTNSNRFGALFPFFALLIVPVAFVFFLRRRLAPAAN